METLDPLLVGVLVVALFFYLYGRKPKQVHDFGDLDAALAQKILQAQKSVDKHKQARLEGALI